MSHLKINKELISKVKTLTDKEKHHVLSIFKKYNIEFTKNSNGYFFNLDKIDKDVIDKVIKSIDLIEEKRQLIYTLDKKRDEHMEYYKLLIENKLKETLKIKQHSYINTLIITPDFDPLNFIKKKSNIPIKIKSKEEDPDILIKAHLKSQKYHKNSIYYKILQSFKLSKEPSTNTNYGSYDEDNYADDIDIDDVVEDVEDVEDVEVDVDVDISDDIDADAADVDVDEYYKEDIQSDSESIETDHDHDDTENTETKTDMKNKLKNAVDLDFYKNLLKQTGFKFDDDKDILIKPQAYIE